jgi:hypothetical protein
MAHGGEEEEEEEEEDLVRETPEVPLGLLQFVVVLADVLRMGVHFGDEAIADGARRGCGGAQSDGQKGQNGLNGSSQNDIQKHLMLRLIEGTVGCLEHRQDIVYNCLAPCLRVCGVTPRAFVDHMRLVYNGPNPNPNSNTTSTVVDSTSLYGNSPPDSALALDMVNADKLVAAVATVDAGAGAGVGVINKNANAKGNTEGNMKGNMKGNEHGKFQPCDMLKLLSMAKTGTTDAGGGGGGGGSKRLAFVI